MGFSACGIAFFFKVGSAATFRDIAAKVRHAM
jgi:hypothetical protein